MSPRTLARAGGSSSRPSPGRVRLPAIFTGFRLAMGFALPVIVGTEFLDGNKRQPNGIGWYIIRSWNLLKVDDLFVGLLVVALIAWILNFLLEVIERRLLPWRAEVM